MRAMAALFGVLLASLPVQAANVVVAHEGYLLAQDDVPEDGSLSMQFRIYDRADVTGQQLVWAGACTVVVARGYYAARFGDGSCGASTIAAEDLASGPRWLEVQVGTVTLTPRLALAPAPVASFAAQAAQFTGTLQGDVQGTQGATIVAGLGGVPIAGTPSASGEVLRFDGSQWTIATLSASDVSGLDTTYVDLAGAQTITGAKTFTTTIDGDVAGNAATVTNGVYTSGTYADPPWLTSLDASKLSGTVSATALAGHAVSSAAPAEGEVLRWNGSAWAPGTGGSGSGSVVPVAASAPASPVLGQQYFDTTTNTMRIWTGTSWTGSAYDLPPVVTSGAPPTGYVGSPYTFAFTASDPQGLPITAWAVVSGALPAGLSLATNGVLSGTPSAAGSSTFSVAALDSRGNSGSQSVTLTIDANYAIARSLRLRASASAKLSHAVTTGSAGTKGTFSAWIKPGALASGTNNGTFLAGSDNFHYGQFFNGTFYFGNSAAWANTAGVFRDSSAWYHVMFVFDTTQATAANRLSIYVNGALATAGSTVSYPAQGANFPFLTAAGATYYLGGRAADSFFDGYLSEVVFVDGQALAPAAFGRTDPLANTWVPVAYAGTFGTNGFYLPFSDNTALTSGTNVGLGKDFSGNGLFWNTSNVSLTAGPSYDSMLDTPTPYADGGTGRGNYCTLNPLDGAAIISDGALKWTPAAGDTGVRATFALPPTGKYYWEVTDVNQGNRGGTGVYAVGGYPHSGTSNAMGYAGRAVSLSFWNGDLRVDTVNVAAGYPTVSTNDVVMLAVDMSAHLLWIGKNGAWFNAGNPAAGSGSVQSLAPGETYAPGAAEFGGVVTTYAFNFGQRPFAHTPPTGFLALNSQNLPAPAIVRPREYFDVTTYTGNGGTQQVTNAGFQPDLVWGKQRNDADRHWILDAVRGKFGTGYSLLSSGNTQGDVTPGTENAPPDGVTALTSNGFTLGANGTATNGGWTAELNQSGGSYVAWQWKEGVLPGLDIVSYTGTGVANRAVPHNLGTAPGLIITKWRTGAYNWDIYHRSLGNSATLTFTSATTRNVNAYGTLAPTATDFYGYDQFTNTNTFPYVSYVFADVPGFSKFGTWTNNNANDGAFVNLGFRPAYVMLKNSDNTETWYVYDTRRQPWNLPPAAATNLVPSGATSEGTNGASTAALELLSNGFKIRTTNPAAGEVSFGTRRYVYAAFAEVPFKYARAR